MVMLYPLWSNPVSAGEDDVIYFYPQRVLVGQALRQGHWPVEDKLTATGVPVLADPQSAVFFPLTWLFAVLPGKLAYSLSIFAAFAIAGAGMFVYLRRLGLLRAASLTGAVAMMFCGFMVGHRVHLSMIQTAAFLPWGLLCIELLRTKPWKSLIVLVSVVSLAVFAGHWPTLIHMMLIWGAYFLLRARPLGRSVLVVGVAAVLVAGITAPQWHATMNLMEQVTRQKIGYATAGENSYFPVAAVLMLFPMLMGSRTPNFYPQQWWGSWHLCEMLGYVGLLTLVLAAAAVWKLYRRRPGLSGGGEDNFTPIARVWTWIAVGAFVFMLGYYLPTYRLVHMLPVLGVVRCPGRMILAVDAALATLAAVGVHVIISRSARSEVLRRAVATGSRWTLPLVMPASLTVLGGLALLTGWLWAGGYPMPFVGRPDDVFTAILPGNPAVWVPLATAAATAAAIWFWLKAPRRRWVVLVVLLLADLFMVARFVDVPAGGSVAPDPENSPAAAWLKQNAPKDGRYRVWGLSDSYFRRAPELLLAKTNTLHGIATISTYGPFQSQHHAHLLGFRIFGTNRDWRRLVRTNRLLSLCGVRYIIVEEGSEYARLLESVRRPSGRPQLIGPELLRGGKDLVWRLSNARRGGNGALQLSTPFMWRFSQASRQVKVQPETVYRISLDARAPAGGAAGFLQAELIRFGSSGLYYRPTDAAMILHPEHLGGEDWRHFEWVFRTSAEMSGEMTFRLLTMSERPIEVRNVSLRASHWPEPIIPPGAKPDVTGKIYHRVAILPPINPADTPIAIFENSLARPPESKATKMDAKTVEKVKWNRAEGLPDVGARPAMRHGPGVMLLMTTLPAGLIYGLLIAGFIAWRRRLIIE